MILLDAGTKTTLLDHEKIDFDKNVSVLVSTNTSGIVPMSPLQHPMMSRLKLLKNSSPLSKISRGFTLTNVETVSHTHTIPGKSALLHRQDYHLLSARVFHISLKCPVP